MYRCPYVYDKDPIVIVLVISNQIIVDYSPSVLYSVLGKARTTYYVFHVFGAGCLRSERVGKGSHDGNTGSNEQLARLL
jgi:hypothetical protein